MNIIILSSLTNILMIIWTVIIILLLVALTTLIERKVMGLIQFRQGPNLVGLGGILQPFADGIKLLFKETIIPYRTRRSFFFFAPMLCFVISLLNWVLIPFTRDSNGVIYNTDLAVILVLVFSSINVYGIILAGWASTSKYSLLGSLRSSAQMLSYEICFTLSLLPVVFLTQSLDFIEIIDKQREYASFAIIILPSFILMYITLLAETNRVPFDLPEAEAELVSGFNTEYSSMIFALFFLAEYPNVILISVILSFCFFSVSVSGGIIIILILLYSFLWIRASMPRYRYDQLMSICWKSMLPITLGYLLLVLGIIFILLNNV